MSFIIGHSQTSISGKVMDASNDSPLAGVSIYLPQLERGTMTNDEGFYTLHNLPNGNYKLLASYIGFQTYSKTILMDSGEIKLDIVLAQSAIEIEEVIVSTPFHKLERENVMKVEHANITELRSKGAITLSEGITNIAGVENVSTGIGIGKPVIRGLSSNRVLVYAQGIRLENQQFGDEHGLGTSDFGVESVEVIKGPASLLYGSDAMGGVLYLNPEKFAMPNTTGGDVNLNYYSNTTGLGSNAGIRHSSEKIKYLLRGGIVSHTDYKTGEGEKVTNSRFTEYDLKAGIGYQARVFKTEIRYNYNRADLGIPEEIGEQTTERSPDLPYQKIGTHILSSKTNVFFNRSSLEAILGFIGNDRKEFEDSQDPALHMKLNTLNYNVQYHLPQWGIVETIVGAQGMHQTNRNFGEELLIPDADTDDIGAMATSHIHISDKSDLQLGIRFDHRNIAGKEHGSIGEEEYRPELKRNYNSFNGALGLKQDLSKNILARINLASGFRAPNLGELTSNGVHEGTNRFEIGNPNLSNEQNFQADLSLEYKSEHVEFFVNAFHNSISDFIFLEPTGDFNDLDPIYMYRQQDATLYGGEIGFHLHPHPLDWLHLESSFESVTGKLKNGGYIPLIPANSFTNTLRVEFDKNTLISHDCYAFLTVRSVLKQDNTSNFETPTSGYNLLSMGLGGTITVFDRPMQVQISGNNLLDKSYVAHLSRLKADGIPNIGRTINMGISIPL